MKIACPRGFLEGSDSHVEPEQLMPPAWHDLCNRARLLGIPAVADGDIFDLVIWGWKRYWGSRATRDFMRSVDGLNCYYVIGNHEGLARWVSRLFWACPNIHVVPFLEVDVNGVPWRVEHFDRFALDWGPFRWLFQGTAQVMLRIAPRLWLRFCKRWRPGAIKPPSRVESDKYIRENDRYNRLSDKTDQNAYCWGQAHGVNMLGGHTHRVNRIGEVAPTLINSGDLRDGSTVHVNLTGIGIIEWYRKGNSIG